MEDPMTPLNPNEFTTDLTIRDWVYLIGEWGKEKGWTFEYEDIPEKLILIVSEIAEAMEDYRRNNMEEIESDDGKPEGFGIELADAIIRILHLCGHLNIPIDELLVRKMRYNCTRPFRHGNLRA